MKKIFHKSFLTILAVILGAFLLNSCQKEYTITAVANDADMGTVTGGGVYKKGTAVQLVAEPTNGYQFAKWDDGNTDNPRTITVEKNATYTAIFDGFTILAVANDTNMGTVVGSGVYKKGTVIQLAAVPITGYQFVKWDDDNTENPRSITVEKNATYTAIFEGGEEFTINVVANDASMGTVTGSGVYKKGTVIQLAAVPITGYQFVKWDDGNTDNPRTITVKKNATYTAIFEGFTIKAVPNNTRYGSVTGGGVYKKGTVIQLAAVPITGYQFVKWDDDNTENPRSITIEKNATYIAIFYVKGSFSVSATKKVLFSPGNLQWNATNGGTATTHVVAGGGTAAGRWRFAPNQWDTIGAGNTNISSTYTGWIDLFGWGTSGYNNKHPYMTSATNTDYGNGNSVISGTNYDWGVYNAIYNPKTNTTDSPGTWRTLTKDEWVYLLSSRTTASGIRYAAANVHGVNGLIIVPDDWNTSIYSLNDTNNNRIDYTSNIISTTDWAKMEAAGCIFLPAAGYRHSNGSLYWLREGGCYWSTMYYSGGYAHEFYFLGSDVAHEFAPAGISDRNTGSSVRLVKDI